MTDSLRHSARSFGVESEIVKQTKRDLKCFELRIKCLMKFIKEKKKNWLKHEVKLNENDGVKLVKYVIIKIAQFEGNKEHVFQCTFFSFLIRFI